MKVIIVIDFEVVVNHVVDNVVDHVVDHIVNNVEETHTESCKKF